MANKDIDHRAIERHVKEINKAYERAARKYPITVPVQGKGFTVSSGIVGAGIEQDPDLVRLLIWLGEQAPGSGHFASQADFAEQTGMPPEDVQVLAHALERDGLVDSMGPFSDAKAYRVSADGRVELRRLTQLRNDPAGRHRYATDAFLRWLYTTAHDQRPIDPTGFLTTAESHFAGGELSGTELHYALARLTHSGLVEEAPTEPMAIAITIDGIDCVLSGATVSDYLNRTRPGDYYSISGNTNVVAGSQGSVVQNNHNNAFDPSALREFAATVQQFAPTLGMAPEQQAELIEDAEILSEETSSETAEPGRVRSTYERIQRRLGEFTTASAGLGALIQQGQQAYSTVFGG